MVVSENWGSPVVIMSWVSIRSPGAETHGIPFVQGPRGTTSRVLCVAAPPAPNLLNLAHIGTLSAWQLIVHFKHGIASIAGWNSSCSSGFQLERTNKDGVRVIPCVLEIPYFQRTTLLAKKSSFKSPVGDSSFIRWRPRRAQWFSLPGSWGINTLW